MTKNVYTIEPDQPFLDRLAEGLWPMAERDPVRLADMLILLPTRRSCRLLREIFPRVTGQKAMLLPRMRPLGDLDEDELYFQFDGILDLDFPPALTPLRRKLLLTQLIQKKDESLTLDQAAHLAEALCAFLNEVQIERCDLKNLKSLVPEDYAKHWQETLEFLDILTKYWPQVLAQEKAVDPAHHRNLVIEAQTEAWRKKPPNYPVIAAGSTGSQPATSDLLDVIASMPQGAVILPGLDTELDETGWQAISESHPQFGMKHWLDTHKIKRDSIRPWHEKRKASSPRVRLLQASMRPAEVSEDWRKLDAKDIPPAAMNGLSCTAFDTVQMEAQGIALMIRGLLEKPDRTIAFVTSDRGLAERVAHALQRWKVEANDSAGAPLATFPAGSFMLDLLAASRPGATPIEYLALLKHPLAACGLDPAACRSRARDAEVFLWRSDTKGEEAKTISGWIKSFTQMLEPLNGSWRKKRPLAEWIDRHSKLAVQIANAADESGELRLWRGPSGEETTLWLDEFKTAAHDFPVCKGEEYAALFESLLRAKKIRPRYGQHPRVSILGPLEARLIHADTVILGGLHEGSWPPEAPPDPWMSRPMRKAFNLPLPERRIGLSAHDFVQLASVPDVILTYSRRSGGAPTVPSRFILQLETVLRALGYADGKENPLASEEPWVEWLYALDQPSDIKPCARPEPRPPLTARPKQMHVTEISTWQRNPYAIYAKHVLGLRKLDPLEPEASAADKGIVIHKALENFLRKYPKELPPHALDELIAIGRTAFKSLNDDARAAAFWWPRFERIAAWFIALEQERRGQGIHPQQPEAQGEMRIAGDFLLKGRADRIDRLADGTLAIIDYKTGSTPKQEDIGAGIEPQLSLLALIAEHGGFAKIPAASVAALAYWKLSGGAIPGEEKPVREAVEALVQAARGGLENLIAAFANADMPYRAVPRPSLQPKYDDYAHLARLAEWGRFGEDA